MIGWCKCDEEYVWGGEGNEDENVDWVGNVVDEVWSDEFDEKWGYNIGEEDDVFWECVDEVLGSGENDDVEDVIDKVYGELVGW